jgi:hypothetical protein
MTKATLLCALFVLVACDPARPPAPPPPPPVSSSEPIDVVDSDAECGWLRSQSYPDRQRAYNGSTAACACAPRDEHDVPECILMPMELVTKP